jgi:membrane fusion protein (multidrug efflux system)
MNNNHPKPMKKLIVIIASASVIACSIVYMMKKNSGTSMSSREMRPIMVEVMQAKASSISRKKSFSGVLKSSNNIVLVSSIPGRIEKINCKPGDLVKKDQLLFQLESDQALATLHEAKATLACAKQALLRAGKLQGSISRAEREKIANNYVLAQSKLESALSGEKATKIIAPFSGQLGVFSITRGTHLSQNEEITRLVALGELEVEFQVPESDIKHFRVGQNVEVLSESHDDLPVSATVIAMDPYSDHVTHTVRIKAKLSQESAKLRDGAYANVTASLGKADDVITVPKQAIITLGNTNFLFVFDNGRARQVAVICGIDDGVRVQIEDGISLGASIIIDPVESIYDNALVQVSKDGQKGAK